MCRFVSTFSRNSVVIAGRSRVCLHKFVQFSVILAEIKFLPKNLRVSVVKKGAKPEFVVKNCIILIAAELSQRRQHTVKCAFGL